MTPSLFDLPLRLGDATQVAPLLIAVLGNKPVPVAGVQRDRIAARASALRFDTMRPYFGSLERDPIHPSAYYLCVDGIGAQPLLLRVAPAATPSSGLFPQAILVGRTFCGSHELVLNVVPFGPGDYARIQVFATRLNPAFAPRPLGARPVIRVSASEPDRTLEPAFEALRKRRRVTEHHMCLLLGELQDTEAFYFAAVWSAIRAGWREGFALQANPTNADQARAAAACTRFGVRSAELVHLIREARRKPFDIELIAGPATLEAALASLREAGITAQSVALEHAEPADEAAAAEICRRHRTVLNTRSIHLVPGTLPAEVASLLA